MTKEQQNIELLKIMDELRSLRKRLKNCHNNDTYISVSAAESDVTSAIWNIERVVRYQNLE